MYKFFYHPTRISGINEWRLSGIDVNFQAGITNNKTNSWSESTVDNIFVIISNYTLLDIVFEGDIFKEKTRRNYQVHKNFLLQVQEGRNVFKLFKELTKNADLVQFYSLKTTKFFQIILFHGQFHV